MENISLEKELSPLSESKAKDLREFFNPMLDKVQEFEDDFNGIIEMEHSPHRESKAKRLRLDIAKIRVAADKFRKEQKAEYIRAGKAIQGAYNIVEYAVKSKEDKLKEIETYTERQEQERIEALQREREEELEKYEADGSQLDLGNMSADVWENYLAGIKSNYEAVKLAEQKAEKERQERERKDRILNDRRMQLAEYSSLIPGIAQSIGIDTEQDTFDSILKDAKEKAEAEKKRQAEIAAENERLKKESEEKERKRKEAEAQAQAEREAREKAEAERKEREAAEAAEAERIASAPDREKLIQLRDYLRDAAGNLEAEKAQQAVERCARTLQFTITEME